ncbi:MAG TPA: globin [Acidimicrobiales bacterium]
MDQSLYDQVGGEPFFTELVERFYDAVAIDELLRPMYPSDLTDAKRHLVLFLVQYWGGPRTYEVERGHPRLRQRHAPFRVTKRARDAWLNAMTGALNASRDVLSDEQYDELLAYFTMAAHQLRNV